MLGYSKDEMLRSEALRLKTIENLGSIEKQADVTLQLSKLSLKPTDYQLIIELAIAGQEVTIRIPSCIVIRVVVGN